MSRRQTGGWSWAALIVGPFWYLSKGMLTKGIWLLVLCVITVGLAIPFVMLYSAARAKGDWYDYRLREKATIDIDDL